MNSLRFSLRALRPRLVCLAMALALAAVCPGVAAAESENVGHAVRVHGSAFVLHAGALLPMAPGTPVRRLDVVRTAPGARVEVVMLDESRLVLGPDTVLAVERYDLGRQTGQGAVRLLFTKGSFRIVTGQLSALRGGPYEIITPFATLGVRGADAWAGFLAPEELGVLHLGGGAVFVRNDGGRCEITRNAEGVRLTSPTAPPQEPTLWSPDRRAQALRGVSFE